MPNSYNWEAMLPEERILLKLYEKQYKYMDIYLCMGRLGIKYKGKLITDSSLIEPIIFTLKRKYGTDRL